MRETDETLGSIPVYTFDEFTSLLESDAAFRQNVAGVTTLSLLQLQQYFDGEYLYPYGYPGREDINIDLTPAVFKALFRRKPVIITSEMDTINENYEAFHTHVIIEEIFQNRGFWVEDLVDDRYFEALNALGTTLRANERFRASDPRVVREIQEKLQTRYGAAFHELVPTEEDLLSVIAEYNRHTAVQIVYIDTPGFIQFLREHHVGKVDDYAGEIDSPIPRRFMMLVVRGQREADELLRQV